MIKTTTFFCRKRGSFGSCCGIKYGHNRIENPKTGSSPRNLTTMPKVWEYPPQNLTTCNDMLCPRLTVPNLLPNEDELTIRVCSGVHSWSFLVILAMTMTMTINSNSVLLVRVDSVGWYESFEHVQKFHVPSSAQHEYFSFVVMPQSHCAESVPEPGRMDHSSLSGVSFLVIPVHSYPFE